MPVKGDKKGHGRTGLERALEKRGLTAYRLHKLLVAAGHKVSLDHLTKQCQGTRGIGLMQAKTYADVLGCTLEELAG